MRFEIALSKFDTDHATLRCHERGCEGNEANNQCDLVICGEFAVSLIYTSPVNYIEYCNIRVKVKELSQSVEDLSDGHREQEAIELSHRFDA